jgi:hypothetical protein
MLHWARPGWLPEFLTSVGKSPFFGAGLPAICLQKGLILPVFARIRLLAKQKGFGI